MTTLADRLSRMQRLVGCIERSTDDPEVLVAARCILDEVLGAQREIEGGCGTACKCGGLRLAPTTPRPPLRIEPTDPDRHATGRFGGERAAEATLFHGGGVVPGNSVLSIAQAEERASVRMRRQHK